MQVDQQLTLIRGPMDRPPNVGNGSPRATRTVRPTPVTRSPPNERVPRSGVRSAPGNGLGGVPGRRCWRRASQMSCRAPTECGRASRAIAQAAAGLRVVCESSFLTAIWADSTSKRGSQLRVTFANVGRRERNGRLEIWRGRVPGSARGLRLVRDQPDARGSTFGMGVLAQIRPDRTQASTNQLRLGRWP
jgi:hypothetical protein